MGSRMIRVLKRDGSTEDFAPLKLAAGMHQAMMRGGQGQYRDAADLAAAIQIYLQRCKCDFASSAALFEMAVRVLRRVQLGLAADAMENHRAARDRCRRQVRVAHGRNKLTWWDKSWLARLGGRTWEIMPSTARIIAGLVERDILDGDGQKVLSRLDLLEMFNARVVEFGLADAVPIAT
ncbi:MAG: hypothetical protein ACE15C_09195 [Phycisphaerae bacterium]